MKTARSFEFMTRWSSSRGIVSSSGVPGFLSLISVTLGLVACATPEPPPPARYLTDPLRISAPASKEEMGKLVWVDDGAWYFLAATPLPAENGLVRVRDQATGEWHDFAVKTRQDWGTQLGRLDSRPLSKDFSGVPGPVPGVCDTQACIDAAPAGTWFNVYPRTSAGIGWHGRVPERIGRLRAQDPRSAVWKTPGEHWVALVDSVGPPRPVGSVGLIGCGGSSALNSQKVSSPGDDPMSLETSAFEHGVDAFVTCQGEKFQVRVPSALRAPLPGVDVRLRTHPVVASRPITVSGDFETVVQWAVSLGLGDFETAALLQPAIAGSNRGFALESAEIASAVGHHEEGLAAAWDATESAWNREADFFWVFLRARVASELRDEAGFTERWARLPDMVRRLEDTRVFGWFVWQLFELESSEAPAANYKEADAMLAGDSLASYRALLRLSRAVHAADPAARASLQEKLRPSALKDSFLGDVPPLGTPGPLDVYGRRWVGPPHADHTRDLTRVGKTSYRPGFVQVRPESAQDQVYWSGMLGRPVQPSSIAPALSCEHGPILVEAGLNLDEGATWALSAGRNAACQGMAPLLEAARAGDDETQHARRDYAVWLVQSVLERNRSFEALQAAAVWASAENLGATCRLWNLSVGFSALLGEQVDAVELALQRANRCTDTSWRASEKRLAAALQWMVSGWITADFEHEVSADVRRTVGQDVAGCVLGGGHDVRLDGLAEPEIAAMIRPIASGVATDSDLSLVTAPARLRDGHTALGELREAVRTHDAVQAAASLNSAKQNFAAVGHLPALYLVTLLERELFKTSNVDAAAVAKASKSREPIWKNAWTPAGPPATQLALAFLRGDWANVSIQAAELPAEYCAMPVQAERGPSIDLDAL